MFGWIVRCNGMLSIAFHPESTCFFTAPLVRKWERDWATRRNGIICSEFKQENQIWKVLFSADRGGKSPTICMGGWDLHNVQLKRPTFYREVIHRLITQNKSWWFHYLYVVLVSTAMDPHLHFSPPSTSMMLASLHWWFHNCLPDPLLCQIGSS